MTEIVQKDDPILRQVAATVSREDFGSRKLKQIVNDMSEALLACDDGVALAAAQIGMARRIFIISGRLFPDAEGRPGEDLVFINPKLTKVSKKQLLIEEGCLSVRWLYGKIKRAAKATVTAFDATGKKFTRSGSGLMAQIFQHEIDHLDGILFIDKAKEIQELRPELTEGKQVS